jgi:hypothetical protein
MFIDVLNVAVDRRILVLEADEMEIKWKKIVWALSVSLPVLSRDKMDENLDASE